MRDSEFLGQIAERGNARGRTSATVGQQKSSAELNEDEPIKAMPGVVAVVRNDSSRRCRARGTGEIKRLALAESTRNQLQGRRSR